MAENCLALNRASWDESVPVYLAARGCDLGGCALGALSWTC